MSAERAITQLRAADGRWSSALRQHRLAPPDEDFARRLRDFADACEQQHAAYSYAAQAGLGWDPLPPAVARRAPHELTPESGRRGPAELWQQFDETIDRLNVALQGVSLQAIARVFGELSDIARQLSVALADEDAAATRARKSL